MQQPQSQPQGSAIPIAVAIQETCSALFLHVQGPEGCKAKVAGEVVMSFPANSITQLASHEPLQFTLLRTEGVERLLHNQNLLLKYICIHVHIHAHVLHSGTCIKHVLMYTVTFSLITTKLMKR